MATEAMRKALALGRDPIREASTAESDAADMRQNARRDVAEHWTQNYPFPQTMRYARKSFRRDAPLRWQDGQGWRVAKRRKPKAERKANSKASQASDGPAHKPYRSKPNRKPSYKGATKGPGQAMRESQATSWPGSLMAKKKRVQIALTG